MGQLRGEKVKRREGLTMALARGLAMQPGQLMGTNLSLVRRRNRGGKGERLI